MSIAGNELENSNVVPLFGGSVGAAYRAPIEDDFMGSDPLQDLLDEAEREWEEQEEVRAKRRSQRVTVTAEQFPDQSMYVLEKQLDNLKQNLSRLNFYLTDLDDLLPR